jgi:hypothetical protein
MAFMGILSTQMLVDQFIEKFDNREILCVTDFKVWRDFTALGAGHSTTKN